MDNATIQKGIREYADMQYKMGGYEKAWSIIDQMDSGTLRDYLKDFIADHVTVGIEILRENGHVL